MSDDDGLSAERATRIADAIEDIERNVSGLERYQKLSRSEYCADEALEQREAVERKFEKLIAATVDVAETILAAEGTSVPGRRKDTIAGLEQRDIIEEDLAQQLRDAVGFRDVLAHTYGPVINDDIVYDALQTGLDRFVGFAEAVESYLDDAIED
ncbi:type VII toxin-antitoxin system HepT family RNase toxin [Halovivax limisalsi]|uniref:type VII toxin-antitoxin system HepT family RNase toxin n=1 Tax=Halovivax limisalsi TaxID=1453760 RepID=UPI001FFD8F80|nr:DUF86 domain-containing protein [Halovivax limisalsi]